MEKTNKRDEKRLSAGEISDVARVVIAYSLLADDKKNSKENLLPKIYRNLTNFS